MPHLDVLQHANVADISTAPRHNFDPTSRLPLFQLMGHVDGPGHLQEYHRACQCILGHTRQGRARRSYYNVAIWKKKLTKEKINNSKLEF